MRWRKILEDEHRLVLMVADAAERECGRQLASGRCSPELMGDILAFFRYFNDGLHDPKEEGLLFARCRKRGMTDEDEPFQQMQSQHDWCRTALDALEEGLRTIDTSDRKAVLDMGWRLHEYIDVIRAHIAVEETVFFDMAQHYLTHEDLQELSEEFDSVRYDEAEAGVLWYWEDLAQRLAGEERKTA